MTPVISFKSKKIQKLWHLKFKIQPQILTILFKNLIFKIPQLSIYKNIGSRNWTGKSLWKTADFLSHLFFKMVRWTISLSKHIFDILRIVSTPSFERLGSVLPRIFLQGFRRIWRILLAHHYTAPKFN